ncbi:NADP-dependent oxidoreductase [Sulfitobacter aestuarii]|uniref:NADP-dependent oxidoreductase n=1 Tax=Sulfitobacter aestuarii TaxID=2161676 RepID=A0ABW5U1S9_9RHOB
MSETMARIVLAARPDGAPTLDDFRLETVPLAAPGKGEVLVRVRYLSLDPYMRGRMDDAKSYAAPVPLGGLMEGGAVGEVVTSNSPHFAPGDIAFGPFGWASHGIAPASHCRKVDPDQAEITTSLGVLGMPGFTGWHGLNEFGRPQSGETLVVAAATGPVGSMVGQLAKSMGLRVIGIAGGTEKCVAARELFGFDACIDHSAHGSADDLRAALKEVCPEGIDIYFENVGGKVLEAVLPLMNPHGRIPICGMIAWYNAGGLGESAQDMGLTAPKLWRNILVKFLSVNGFIISNHWNRFPEFLNQVAPLVADGSIAVKEDITDGLENAPQAFIDLLEGGNFGKAIVKVA